MSEIFYSVAVANRLNFMPAQLNFLREHIEKLMLVDLQRIFPDQDFEMSTLSMA